MINYQDSIAVRLDHIETQVQEAAVRAGRTPGDVKLIVVTKGHSIEIVRKAINAGANLLGENYVEEGTEKILQLGKINLEWHMIGHVQSRKAEEVVKHFDWVHSVDSIKLASRLERFCSEIGKRLPVLIEANTSGEETKFGYPIYNKGAWGLITQEIKKVSEYNHIEINGLMTMAPYVSEPIFARPYFQMLREFKEYVSVQLPEIRWTELSMGMSSDFQVAIAEGSTMVRIGQAILGPRN